MRENTKLAYLSTLVVLLLYVGLAASTPAPAFLDPVWKSRLDRYMRNHLQEARFHVSFQSTSNEFEQYYRNANLPIASIDVIKLPIVYEVLWQDRKKTIELDKTVPVTAEDIKANRVGYLGPEDVGRSFSLRQLCDITLQFNDNAAANILLAEVGYQNIVDRLREKDLQNIYIRKPLTDSLKNTLSGATNFVTAADMQRLVKRIQSERKLKNKDILFESLLQNAQKNNNFALKGERIAGIAENTELAKGFIAMVENTEDHSYILSMFVSDFKSDADGTRFLSDMISIFNGIDIADDSLKVQIQPVYVKPADSVSHEQ